MVVLSNYQRSPAMPATPLEMSPKMPEAPLKSPKLRRKLMATLINWLLTTEIISLRYKCALASRSSISLVGLESVCHRIMNAYYGNIDISTAENGEPLKPTHLMNTDQSMTEFSTSKPFSLMGTASKSARSRPHDRALVAPRGLEPRSPRKLTQASTSPNETKLTCR